MEKSFPFNAVIVDGTPDRVYTAEDFAAERAAYVSNGVTAADALIVSPAAAGGMQVDIAPGAAVINGYTYWNTAALPLLLTEADASLPRVDLILLRLDLAARRMYCAVKTGTPAAQPVQPSPESTAEIVEIPLASVSVAAAETVVETMHITDLRPRADYILNPKDVDAAIAEYAAALENYFGEENAETLISASRILRTDAGSDTVLYGDGTYRELPPGGTAMVELVRFTSSGTFDPAQYPTVDGSYTVFLQGAGGGGAFGDSAARACGGGAGGYALVQILPCMTATSYKVTVGVGGAGITASTTDEYAAGNAGGRTSFGSFSVPGGAGGSLNGTNAGTGYTFGPYTSGIGSWGPSGKGASSLLGAGSANVMYEHQIVADSGVGAAGIGAGGGAQAVLNYYSGTGGDGIVIVYGCPA